MSFRPRAQLPDPEPESIELRTSTINMARDSELEPEHGEATHLIESREGSVAQNMKPSPNRLLFKLGLSFFVFGLINNVLYVIILSAALDLVPPSTPKGIIAFCNIAPALVAKVAWPYVLKGKIRYVKRILGCWLMSTMGMFVVAAFDSLWFRLLGISLASFSSGLGELTFLQLSTTYTPPSVAGHSVGYFASGTGAAGLVGAFVWWEMRSFGVRTGVGISSVFPLVTPFLYFLVTPKPKDFSNVAIVDESSVSPLSPSEYTPLAQEPIDDEADEGDSLHDRSRRPRDEKPHVSLSAEDKWRLVKPLLVKYMLPLFAVYTFEYTINQGIAPTLVYPTPDPKEHPIMSLVIHSIRDYYPLWQLVYQATVFLSRSSISLGLPPLPSRLLPLPAIVQLVILVTLALESGVGVIPDSSEGLAFGLVFLLISIEGICGGLAYVNVFFQINQEHRHQESGDESPSNRELARQEHEFQIGSIGFADSSGILLASLLAMPTEIGLCNAQKARGKLLCSKL